MQSKLQVPQRDGFNYGNGFSQAIINKVISLAVDHKRENTMIIYRMVISPINQYVALA